MTLLNLEVPLMGGKKENGWAEGEGRSKQRCGECVWGGDVSEDGNKRRRWWDRQRGEST